jgi:hypothetical protein
MDLASLACGCALAGAAVTAATKADASIAKGTPFVFLYFLLSF